MSKSGVIKSPISWPEANPVKLTHLAVLPQSEWAHEVHALFWTMRLFVFFFSRIIVHKTQSTMEQTYPQPFVSPSATLLGHAAVIAVPPSSIPAYTQQQFYLALSRRKTQPSFPAQILQIHDYSLALPLFKWLPDWIFSIHKLKIAQVSMACFLEAAFSETLISIIS